MQRKAYAIRYRESWNSANFWEDKKSVLDIANLIVIFCRALLTFGVPNKTKLISKVSKSYILKDSIKDNTHYVGDPLYIARCLQKKFGSYL